MVRDEDLEQPEEQKVSFGKLESKLDKIINEPPFKERSITQQQTSARKLPWETQEQWAKRMRDEQDAENKKFSERATKALSQLDEIPEAEAIPIVIGKEMKVRTDYNKEKDIYLKQQDRDRLNFLENKKNLTGEEKHKISTLKSKRRQNKHKGKTYP